MITFLHVFELSSPTLEFLNVITLYTRIIKQCVVISTLLILIHSPKQISFKYVTLSYNTYVVCFLDVLHTCPQQRVTNSVAYVNVVQKSSDVYHVCVLTYTHMCLKMCIPQDLHTLLRFRKTF